MAYLQNRRQTIIEYDRGRFDFRAWAARTLGCPDPGRLHETLTPAQRADLDAARRDFVARLEAAFGEVHDQYLAFVDEVVAPRFGRLTSFQDPPIFRVQLDGFGTISPFHCDRFFNDDPDSPVLLRSRNVWVPLTEVRGNNSLWVESKPGKEDFEAVELGFGEALIFDAMSLQHGSRPNDSGVTRVSFELRALPWELQPLTRWCGLYHPTVVRRADGGLERAPDLELRADGTVTFGGERAVAVEYAEAGSRLSWRTNGGSAGAVEFHVLEDGGAAAPGCNFTGTLRRGTDAPLFFSGVRAMPTPLSRWAGFYARTSIGRADGSAVRGPALRIEVRGRVTLGGSEIEGPTYDPFRSVLAWPAGRNSGAGRLQFHDLTDHGPERYTGPAFYGTLRDGRGGAASRFSGVSERPAS